MVESSSFNGGGGGGVLINYSRLLLSDLIMFIYVVTRE